MQGLELPTDGGCIVTFMGRLNVLNLRRDGLVGRDVGVTERRMYF